MAKRRHAISLSDDDVLSDNGNSLHLNGSYSCYHWRDDKRTS
ncbi:hypothetical protein VCR4J5_200018 [Vibrio crassostreae]|uniref:Uncharacterized protein n=1 Tax=Vibrio crassostreae TaxID=246167 RepID=A0ABM9QTN0_9VIBR|nr:hypothetical protein VCR4J5_200018 [Vibrio crassostreae]CDT48096.1 hypothetical protein VCR19J5_560018 [Vibrio crassostreae]